MTIHDAGQGTRPGFISGPILAVLLLSLMISLTLSGALGYAVSSSRHKIDSLRAHLAFEEALLRLDLGSQTSDFSLGEFTVTLEEESGEDSEQGFWVRLKEAGALREEVWLSAGE